MRDPGHPGRYLVGIECDGAGYHSARTVHDRDRLRQAVLERLGWRMRRIWSTDFYRNPEAEIGPILRELEGLRSQPAAGAEPGEPTPAGEGAGVPTGIPSQPGEQSPVVVPAGMPGPGDTDGKPVDGTRAPEQATPNAAMGLDEVAEVLRHEAEAAAAEIQPPPGLDLRGRLTWLDQTVIRPDVPDTPEAQRLLRPAMLEALLEFRPATRAEFVELIPRYLRQATSPTEGRFIDEVLRLIEEAEEAVAQ